MNDNPARRTPDTGPPLKLGICLWNQALEWSDVLETTRLVEESGYDHVWIWDHLLERNRSIWRGAGRGAEPDMTNRRVFPDPDSTIWLGTPARWQESSRHTGRWGSAR